MVRHTSLHRPTVHCQNNTVFVTFGNAKNHFYIAYHLRKSVLVCPFPPHLRTRTLRRCVPGRPLRCRRGGGKAGGSSSGAFVLGSGKRENKNLGKRVLKKVCPLAAAVASNKNKIADSAPPQKKVCADASSHKNAQECSHFYRIIMFLKMF